MPLNQTDRPNMTALTDRIRFNRIVFRDRVFTKEYLSTAVDECARSLDNNIRSNSPVVYLFGHNHIKTVIAFLAIAKTGRATLLVDPKTGRLEYEEMLADTMPSAIIRIDPVTLEFDLEKEIELTDYRMDTTLVRELDDVAVMLYTAAEDGHAKAAMLTHRNMLSNAQVITEDNHVDSESTSCAVLPFHHVFGFQYGIITPLVGGGSILIIDISNSRRIDLIAEELYRHKTTQVYSIPLLYYSLSKSPRIGDISRQAHSLICGGYKLPASLKSRFEQKCGIPILEGYGLTETSAGCLWQRRSEKYANGSIGRAVKNCRVRIFDEADNEVASGIKGEICVQGDTIMKGYFNCPEATRKALHDGWLHTGDFGKQDREGNVFFLGLKKRMFNVAGNKVYPVELRRLLKKHDTIESCELRSEYQEIYGDRIKATIKLKNNSPATVKEFNVWCTEVLTAYKVPREFTFL
jgi:long-chain acyl-CoA synthetase